MQSEHFNFDLKSLATLLADPNQEESDDDNDKPVNSSVAKMGPGSIGPKKKESTEEKKSVYEKTKTKNIWDENEVEEGAEFDTSDDPRIAPEYEIVYKQKVTSEDIFLQMGAKTPATSSCEDMVVRITMPGVQKLTDIDLDLHDKFLDCRTSQYRLGLHLPYSVDSKASSAKWDAKQSILIVTMPLVREFDFVNF